MTLWVGEQMKARRNASQSEKDATPRPRTSRKRRLLPSLVSSKLVIVIFCLFYIAFVIFFGNSLSHWSLKDAGRCYLYDHVAAKNSRHPYVDIIYLSATSICMFGILISCSALVYLGDIKLLILIVTKLLPDRSKYSGRFDWVATLHAVVGILIYAVILWVLRLLLVATALLQYPLHLYMVITLRKSNKRAHGDGDSEDTWGFGQVVALILVIPVLKTCVEGYIGKQLLPFHVAVQEDSDFTRICRQDRTMATRSWDWSSSIKWNFGWF